MTHDEIVLLTIGGVALAGLIVFKAAKPMRESIMEVVTGGQPIMAFDMSQDPTAATFANGPAYMTYNAPWPFFPARGNVAPSNTVGQVGQTAETPSDWPTGGCGCGF